jgi:tRNA modification GTPase
MAFSHPPHLQPDTIVAISTPPGRGGIGIVRLSGPNARAIAEPMLRLRNPLEHARARFGDLLDTLTSTDTLDQAVTTFFAAPNSYTGEDLVEIALHGSPVLLDHAVRQCLAAGARLAEPGEFTQRAFLAGRIDLTQAEAVHDLIASSTLEQARLAARQMGGSLAHATAPIKSDLVTLIATLEAGIDFAEDDIDVLPAADILSHIDAILQPLRTLEQTFARGRILREGLRLAIVGRPNAGKSSLFNRLLERERAIVTASPGTTRDTVSERVAIRGIPVELIDTAGLRDATDEAERLGIARSRQAMAEADLTLLVLDASAESSADDQAIVAEHQTTGRPLLIALNKSDLLDPPMEPGAPSKLRFGGFPDANIRTSATTGLGLEDLRTAIVAAVGATPTAEPGTLTSLRQHTSVQAAIAGLEAAHAAVQAAIPHEMLLLDLYEALRGLDALTGATTTDDILHLVFSTFCIGK